ncbi:MAG: intradiol ring-cleavage dioxygenase [Betaproteobacteria bacterium HGW-Betaproteobacteria-7]|jgi:protocatechuate 3,4-dioxygenase beta subunit|nr:MAG: intradiol ring-cleavage dioxygenase [Betaproteobacteria bacterium HGW-Betaproteobacteria-7]
MNVERPVFPLTTHGLSRRRTVAAVLAVAPALLLGVRAQPVAVRQATPAQTEGPFYPLQLPADADADLLRNGRLVYRSGQAAWVEGQVIDLAGRPVKGAQVEIWQCDHAGHYHHPGDGDRADQRFQGFGKVVVAEDGHYRFRTIRPVAYSGRTPHIHVKVRLGSRELLTTQLYVAGDPGNPRDFLWRRLDERERAALTVPFVPGSDGLQATFPIIVAA